MTAFKKSTKKQFRKRKLSSDSDELSDVDQAPCTSVVSDIKELQRARDKPKGVSSVGLALGKKITQAQDVESHDPFKMRTGGYIDMKALKTKGTALSEEEKEAIGTAFAAETNRRDEDAEMQKYVEEELNRRKGVSTTAIVVNKQKKREDALYELPDELKSVGSSAKRTEDMLSNQMLSGIPEIDLGIMAKIKNIEETEEAKQKLIDERMKKKEDVSVFVPTNMAVNFVQHNRFHIEDNARNRKAQAPDKPAKLVNTEKARPLTVQPDEKATDNYHFERFKRQMRR